MPVFQSLTNSSSFHSHVVDLQRIKNEINLSFNFQDSLRFVQQSTN